MDEIGSCLLVTYSQGRRAPYAMPAFMWLSWEVEGTRKASSSSIRNSRTYQPLKTLAPRMEKSSPCFPDFLVVILLLTPVPDAYIRIPSGVVPLNSLPKREFSPSIHSPWVNTFIPIKKNGHLYTYNSYTSISKHFPESQIYGSSFLDIATWILRDPSTLKVQNQAHCHCLHIPACFPSRVFCIG